jgi:hypothetical protein
MFYQALEASGGFLIIYQYNWHGFSTDLQKNVAAHCLATCFLHLLRLNLKRKYKIRGSIEKFKVEVLKQDKQQHTVAGAVYVKWPECRVL